MFFDLFITCSVYSIFLSSCSDSELSRSSIEGKRLTDFWLFLKNRGWRVADLILVVRISSRDSFRQYKDISSSLLADLDC